MAWLDWLNPFNLGEALAETLFGLSSIFTYPLMKMTHPLFYILTEFYNAIVNLGLFIFWIIDFIWNTVIWAASALFPSPIAIILGLIFFEVAALAFIRKIGGISIAGFSIGKG